MNEELRCYAEDASAEFDPFGDYRLKMTEVFSIENIENRIRMLEDYRLSKHVGFQHPFLPPIVNEMMRTDRRAFSISETARKFKISRTTLVKHFDLHVCATPSYFKKIVRLEA